MTSLSNNDAVFGVETSQSSVSWSAIIAGSLTTTALLLILLILGSGLGLAVVSPWAATGVGAATFAVSTVIWLFVTQWVSAGLGGYLAGRLRTKWSGVHSDEICFRDTAHGFFSWSLSTVLIAGLLGSAVASIVGGGASAVSSVASGVAQVALGKAADGSGSFSIDYFNDTLFRPAEVPSSGVAGGGINTAENKSEAGRILVAGIALGSISIPDKTRLASLISANTGMAEPEAQKRVDMVLAQIEAGKANIKEATDSARKAGVTLSLMTFLSLLVGAFIACVAAALGGKRRDEY